jgi:hypothetical protein
MGVRLIKKTFYEIFTYKELIARSEIWRMEYARQSAILASFVSNDSSLDVSSHEYILIAHHRYVFCKRC